MTKLKSPELTPERKAFEAAQAQIRACVAAPGNCRYFTWYFSGNVTVTENGVAEQAGRAWDMSGFNALLEQHGVKGLQGRGALKSKCPEKLKP